MSCIPLNLNYSIFCHQNSWGEQKLLNTLFPYHSRVAGSNMHMHLVKAISTFVVVGVEVVVIVALGVVNTAAGAVVPQAVDCRSSVVVEVGVTSRVPVVVTKDTCQAKPK